MSEKPKPTLYIHLGKASEARIEAGLEKPEDLVNPDVLATAAVVECATCCPDVHIREVHPGVWMIQIGHDNDCSEWKQRLQKINANNN